MFLVGLLLQLVLRLRPEGILPEKVGSGKSPNSQGELREKSSTFRSEGS